MNTHTHLGLARFFSAVMVLVMVFTLGSTPAQAQDGQPEQEGQVYLVAPAMPDLENADLVGDPTNDERVQLISEQLVAEQSIALRHQLRELQMKGLIGEIEQLEGGLFRIIGVDPAAMVSLGQIKEIGALRPDRGEIPACLLNAQEQMQANMKEMVRVRQMQDIHTESAEIQPAGVQIDVYISPYSDWSYIYGEGAPPSTELKLSLLRGGVEIFTGYSFSSEDGYFSFWPDYSYCTDYSYTWIIQAGDIVRISSAGNTWQTVAAPITGWANPNTDEVFGTTSPNRSVRITVGKSNRTNPCGADIEGIKTGVANSSGNFSVDTTSVIDFDRSGYVTLESLDGNGATIGYAEVYHLVLFIDEFAYGYYLPGQSYTLKLQRGATTLETLSGTTDEYGNFYEVFSSDVLVGDKAVFTSGPFTMNFNVIDLSDSSINRATGQVSVSSTPGVLITARRYNETYAAQSRCGGTNCVFGTIPGGGTIDLNVGTAYKGEDIEVGYITPEGESFWYVDNETTLFADLYWDDVFAYWPYYFTGDLTITLKNSVGTVLETQTAYESRYNYFYAWFSTDIIGGDKIEVTDGTYTETMDVQGLTDPRLNSNLNLLTGASPIGGRILAEFYSQDQYICREYTSPGAYTLNPNRDIQADEYAYVNYRDPDGHYTLNYAESFYMYVSLSQNYIYGGVETIAATITWNHKRGGGSIGSGIYTPSGRYFYITLDQIPIAGDQLEITTSDGNHFTLTVPPLSVNLDPAGRRIYGQGPANHWIDLWLFRTSTDYTYGDDEYFESHTSGAGQYSTTLPNGLLWYYSCAAADLNHPCVRAEADVTTSDGFTYWVYTWPDPIAADSFEADNTYTAASAFSGYQKHTLHLWDDEDWVKFTVTPQDVADAHSFHINTIQLGWDMDLYMELYGPDGTTLLDSDYNENFDYSGQGPQIYHTFTAPGTYYLRIHSKPVSGDRDGGYCDSVYTLLIFADEKSLYLPTINR